MSLDRARAAQRLLSDAEAMGLLDALEADILKTWRAAPESPAREACWHDMSALTRLRAKLKSWAGDLVKAEHEKDRK